VIILIVLIFISLVILAFLLSWIDYSFFKSKYFKSEKFDLNICCGDTSCGKINADIFKRDVSNFVLIKDIYKLPFKDKQFKNTMCSHTMEHVEDPIKFFRELKRVSDNITILVPPLWDYGCMFIIWEHKRQFLTFVPIHKNRLPKFFNLPFSSYIQNKFGQKMNPGVLTYFLVKIFKWRKDEKLE